MSRTLLAALTVYVLASAVACKSPEDCKGDSVVCGDGCVDLDSDNLNCGACGTPCTGGQVCSLGACASTCAPGLVACPGGCVDPATDRLHCGASGACSGATAGAACDAGEVCSAGTCQLSCQAGLVDCNGKCIDPVTDRAHCGASGTCSGASAGQTCASGQVCAAGACATSCPAGQLACGGKCVDPQSDRAYCGARDDCTGGTTCGSGQACYLGGCVDVCAWVAVYSAALDALPPGGTFGDGAMGGQGVAAVYGRTAWYVTSDWNLLTVPVTLTSADDRFAVEVDFYLPAGSATREQRAGIFLFNDPNFGASFGTHGLLSTVQNSGASSVLRWWVYPLANPPDAFNSTTAISFVPDSWHSMRVEGRRSTCTFETSIDGVPVGAWAGTCDTGGATMGLYSRNNVVQPTGVAFSNLRIYRAVAGCAP